MDITLFQEHRLFGYLVSNPFLRQIHGTTALTLGQLTWPSNIHHLQWEDRKKHHDLLAPDVSVVSVCRHSFYRRILHPRFNHGYILLHWLMYMHTVMKNNMEYVLPTTILSHKTSPWKWYIFHGLAISPWHAQHFCWQKRFFIYFFTFGISWDIQKLAKRISFHFFFGWVSAQIF